MARPQGRYTIIVALLWILGGAVSLWWNLYNQRLTLFNQARTAARTAIQKDLDYRRWASVHGGVYVPVTEFTQPNPYLAQVPGRDITGPSGQQLTLMNPSFMNREVYEIERLTMGARGHLTSERPLRPENTPDPWEAEGLKQLAAGAVEVSALVQMEGAEFIRTIHPVRADEPCLKCHVRQGYRVGDLIGGLTVSLPMAPFRAASAGSFRAVWLWHFWGLILGLATIGIGASGMERYQRRQDEAEERIRRSLEEKEVLLREIHHRVKNNLQVISGMLELKAAVTVDEGGRTALKEGRDRISTMALIHEHLYRSGDMARIGLDGYLRSLSEELYRAYGLNQSQVALSLDLASVPVDVDTAIPTGLILTELITNALKYAHPASWRDAAGRPGLIAVALSEVGEGTLRLRVADDGVGLPPGFDIGSSPSLGLKLVRSLAGLMGGTVEFSSRGGTAVTVFIPCKAAGRPGEV